MEVAPSGPRILSGPLRRGTPLPLSQLVEESGGRAASVPNHLLESRFFTKLKSNSLIQAEPSVLHFSGFELGKDYSKILKLINISSEVMNIHIIPTQTKHFQTTYTKKYRLIPGLAYTLKVGFRPDEWRYFYDCVRVHCKGEENLLIPVHAYPVIDDLRIPPHIDLSAVPLGQSVFQAIPLRCSCPTDFEFQVYVIQPHEAFSIHPLTGVIPANGEMRITVTFTPVQYETSQVTIQLVVSQFNTKPYLCTITGSCAPNLTLSQLEKNQRLKPPAESKASSVPRSKTKYRSTKEADNTKTLRDQADVKPRPVDVCTPAGVAKMLIKDTSKLSSKDLKEAISRSSVVGQQNRQLKEALFLKKVQQNVKEEQTNRLKWQVHLGLDPMSEQSRRQVVEEREIALHEYMVKRGNLRQDEDFAAGPPKLSSGQVLREAGQAPEGAPSFQFYTGFQWELRQRALRRFQQAARKVVLRCRMNRRLASLKKLAVGMKNLPSSQKAEEEKTYDLKISPDKVFPSSFPIFSKDDDPLTRSNLVAVPVDPIDATVTTRVPFFKLRVPQHYKLMGYLPVAAWDAYSSYIPKSLARPLRTGPLDEPVPNEVGAQSPRTVEPEAREEELHENEEEALLRPFPANPLRIVNPAPGLHPYKPTPKCLESDLEFHLFPLPRYPAPESNMCGIRTQTPHTQKSLDHKAVIPSVMKSKNFKSIALDCLSDQPAPTSDCAPRSVDYGVDTLPLAVPPPLHDAPPLMDTQREGSGVQMTPEMIRALFLSGEALVADGNVTTGITARHQRDGGTQRRPTGPTRVQPDGKKRMMSRPRQLEDSERTSRGEDCE